MRRAVQLIYGVVVAVVALGLAAQIKTVTSVPGGYYSAKPVNEPKPWQETAEKAPTTGLCRELMLEFRDDRMMGRYDLYLPTGHVIHKKVHAGEAHESPRWFVHQILGDVMMQARPMVFANEDQLDWSFVDFRPPVVLSPPPDPGRCGPATVDRVRIQVPMKPFFFELRQQIIEVRGAPLVPDRDFVTIVGDEVLVGISTTSHLREGQPRTIELWRPAQRDPWEQASRLEVHPQRDRAGLADMAMSGVVAVHPLLARVAFCVPLIMLWSLLARLRRYRLAWPYGRLERATASVLSLAVGAGLGLSLLWVAPLPGWWWVHAGVSALLLAAAVVGWPAALLFAGPGREATGRRRVILPGVVGMGVLAAVLAGFRLGEPLWGEPVSAEGWAYLTVGGAALAAYGGCLLITSTWLSGARAALTAGGATVVAVGYAIAFQLVYARRGLTVTGVWVFAVAGTVLLVALAGAAAVLTSALVVTNAAAKRHPAPR